MALINCPECNKEISDTCDKCIYCGYMLNQNCDNSKNVKLKKQINWKIVLGSASIITIIILGFSVFSKGNEFKEYTKYLGKQYTEIPGQHVIEQEYDSIFSVNVSYLPKEVGFDQFGGTFTYTCAAEEILSKYKEGEVISMVWVPDNDYISDFDAESMLHLLEKTYGKYKNGERDKYYIEYVWENVNGMDITFTAFLNGDIGYGDTRYYIHWCEH